MRKHRTFHAGVLLLAVGVAVSGQPGQNPKIGESTPGTRLAMEPLTLAGTTIPRGNLGGQPYTLRAEGFPKDVKLHLWVLFPGQPEEPRKPIEAYVARYGELQEYGSKSVLIVLLLSAELKGVPYTVGLTTPDGSISRWIRFTPYPIKAHDGPCQVSAEVEKGPGEVYLLSGSGFQSGEELKISLAWEKEIQESTGRSREDGTWQGRVTLAEPKKKSYKAKVKLSGRSCQVTLTMERLASTKAKK